jgi:hypothetical protein
MIKIKVEVEGVKWEADDMEDVADLPINVIVVVEAESEDIEDIENALEDELSNSFGFTHEGWDSYILTK